MRVSFEDGSFIDLNKEVIGDNIVAITMCGLKDDGKTLMMSTSVLSSDQVREIIEFLTEASKKVE